MKTQSLIFLIFAGVCICSCDKDYLEKAPLGSLNETSLANIKGVEGLLIGAYSVLDGVTSDYENPWYSAASNWIYGSICGSEAYTGSDPSDDPRTVILSMMLYQHSSLFNDNFLVGTSRNVSNACFIISLVDSSRFFASNLTISQILSSILILCSILVLVRPIMN